jgi:hypothetical protein
MRIEAIKKQGQLRVETDRKRQRRVPHQKKKKKKNNNNVDVETILQTATTRTLRQSRFLAADERF